MYFVDVYDVVIRRCKVLTRRAIEGKMQGFTPGGVEYSKKAYLAE